MTEAPRTTAFNLDAVTPAFAARATRQESQAWLYLWLADVFAAAPEQETVTSYRFGAGADWLKSISRNACIAQGVAQMQREFARPLDDCALTARLGIGHARLFLGPGGPRTVAPYESAWRCPDQLHQVPLAEMEMLLTEKGLSSARPEPADHLAVELTLMAHLIASHDPSREALRQRLTGWVPAFCRLCVKRDHTDFWAGAALILACLLDQEDGKPPGPTDHPAEAGRPGPHPATARRIGSGRVWPCAERRSDWQRARIGHATDVSLNPVRRDSQGRFRLRTSGCHPFSIDERRQIKENGHNGIEVPS